MQYRVYDTFNNVTRSRHRTIEAAVKAERKLLRAVKRANGQNSYLPTRIEEKSPGGKWETAECDQVAEARIARYIW